MKNPVYPLIALAVFTLPQTASASSLSLIFCSENTAMVRYEVNNADETPNVKIRDIDTTGNSISISVGNGIAEIDSNFASAWSGSNNNIEALFVNASGAQVGAVARCPAQ
jgi:hypothetical protein